MKRLFSILVLALAIPGLGGCDDDDEESGGASGDSIAGSWSGTMVATKLMGQPVEESDVVPFTMNIQQYGTLVDVVFQASGYPGVFNGTYYSDDSFISFSATADYNYHFLGKVAPDRKSMSGTWSVDIPGGMSGTWQASR